MMLENVVESKSDKVAELESKVQYLSSKTAIPCDKCENTFVSKDTSSDHNAIPTTSKCGSCEFESDSENEIQMHMKSGHDLLCSVCDLKFESENKLNMHTCRLEQKIDTKVFPFQQLNTCLAIFRFILTLFEHS